MDQSLESAELPQEDENIVRILQNGGISQFFISLLKTYHFLDRTQLFITPPATIAFTTGIPIKVCEKVLDLVSAAVMSQTPIEIITEPTFEPVFYDKNLDDSIPIPRDGILEFVGPAGTGKSNVIYHIAISQICHDASRSVVIISTEGSIPTERIRKMCAAKGYDPTEVMDRLLISTVNDVGELCKTINNSLPELFNRLDPPPSIVIIDSIAALFRAEFDVGAAVQRAQVLFEVSTTLKWLSHSYKALIITTNQVTANMNPFTTKEWVPSLGLAWSNCISVRIELSKSNIKRDVVENMPVGDDQTVESVKQVTLRSAYVQISPRAQDVKVSFYISDSGIHGI